MSRRQPEGPAKTNAARLLDRARIAYDLVPYEVDENNLAAEHVAEQLGEPIEQVFKTIVLTAGPHDFFVCVVPGNCEIDLKKAARTAGYKKVELLHMKDLLGLTGYIRGGCSPIGMKKAFPTFYHHTATDFDVIYVSAGQRGLQLRIAPDKLIEYTHGTLADLTVDPE
ncbi:MAG: Cys-tRNA(Pro) deacylase [Muribaculaceae bacterium]|nr:Cys-tRNA(Pro) deacylase [Muribaculaceae bacterium]